MVRPPCGRRLAAAAFALAATLHGIAAFGAQPELVLLDFWSPTCGPCMQMKPTVEALIQARYPIRQINVSQEPELARQYGVTGIPCFVMLVDGHEVDRVVGATSSERLLQMFTRAKEVVEQQRRMRGQSPSQPPTSSVAEDQNGWSGGEDASARSGDVTAPVPVPGVNHTVEPAPPEQVDSKLLSSSARLTVEDAKARSHGTATIIDAREGEALLITCGHLFRDSKGQAPVNVEIYENGPQGLRVVETVQGKVVSYDLDRDVAFVSIRPTRPVCVAAVAPQRTQVAKGDLATSVGCSNGQDPTVMETRITWLDRYQGPPNVEASGAPVVGRSGGGLFNEKGELIGVCFAADYESNRGLYAGLESIHDELTRLGLEDICARPAAGATANNGANSSAPRPPDPIVRGQELATPAPEPLKAIEQATLEEVVSRAATKKVTCIIQSDEPGVENEIISIENVSNEFVEALAARRRKEPAIGPPAPVAQANRDEAPYNR
jgi:thiol-disulfide isomerase/thioredoxin